MGATWHLNHEPRVRRMPETEIAGSARSRQTPTHVRGIPDLGGAVGAGHNARAHAGCGTLAECTAELCARDSCGAQVINAGDLVMSGQDPEETIDSMHIVSFGLHVRRAPSGRRMWGEPFSRSTGEGTRPILGLVRAAPHA